MIEPSLQLGGGNWANKSDSLLGYHKDGANFYADELTFSRNSLGSYTDANGLIQSMPYNLVEQSETFDNAIWTKVNTTVVANAETAPNGTITADTMTVPDSTTNLYQGVSYGSGEYTFSVYVKVISQTIGGLMRLQGLVDGTGVNLLFTPTTEWQRVSATYTATTSITSLRIRGLSGEFVGTLAIYGAQLNSGSTAKPYFATTTRLNLARVDYKDNVNGSLLLEPQRTNLVTYSEDFSNAAWTKNGVTVTANQAISPDGYQNADKLTEDSSTTAHYAFSVAASVTSGSSYTISFFVKNNGGDYVVIRPSNSNDLGIMSTFNLTSGSVVSTLGTATITNYGNGWYRCTATGTATVTRTQSAFYYINRTNGAFPFSYTGDGTSGIYIYGAQLEAGSYATSYIPTLASSVTRLGDDITNAFLQSGGFLGSNTGAMFVSGTAYNLSANAVLNFVLTAQDSTTKSFLFDTSSNQIRLRSWDASSNLQSLTSGTITGNYKLCVSWTSSTIKFFINGSLIGTISQTTYPYTTIRQESTNFSNNIWGEVVFFSTNIADADAINLTTL